MLNALKYKLQMFGIEMMENETSCFGDSSGVILNLSVPELTLKKHHYLININYAQEAVVPGMALIYKVDTGSNILDQFKKLLDKVKGKEIIQPILY